MGLINFPEVLINFKAFSGGSKSALNKTLILITLESIQNLFESNSAERINREGLVRGDKIPFDGFWTNLLKYYSLETHSLYSYRIC